MLKPSGLLALVCFAVATSAAQFDPPDLNLEFQLHSQYIKTRDPQPALESPQGLLENYQLQQGESLWGLSQMLYGDGNYWPKVWAQNQSITNPHLIRKGHTLQFLMGSEDETPAFRFSESDDSGLELAAATTSSSPQIQVPPPESPPRPVLRVPPSFPDWQQVYRKRKDKFKIDDSKIGLRRHFEPDKIPLSAFVQDKPIESLGTFLEVEKESGLPVAMQYVYVKLKKGAGKVGQKLLMVKDHGVIRKLNDQVEGQINARFIQVFGDVELTEVARSSFKSKSDAEKFDVFRALLTHAINLSLTDFDLIPGTVEIVDMSRTGPSGTTTAQIIGSAKSFSSALYGGGDIVFLNRGSRDGVQVGQILDIYIDRTIRDSETLVGFSNASSGMMKIAKVSETCSTGIVLSAVDSIQQGDRAQKHLANRENFGESVRSLSPSTGGTPEGEGAGVGGEDDLGPPPISNSGDELELSE